MDSERHRKGNSRDKAPPEPRVPQNLHPLAREILEELRSSPGAEAIIIGGGVALQHYCEYRGTVDLDAWWKQDPSQEAQHAIQEAMAAVAKRHGLELGVRSWRETQSYELKQGKRKVFSFQISQRTVELDPPLRSAWEPVKIETFRDNLGAKMNALVERGAPRDFLDIHEICARSLATVSDCWAVWAKKNPGLSPDDARIRVLHHLEILELRRPLETITDKKERQEAEAVRLWIKESFLKKNS